MRTRQRQILFLLTALISLVLLAAPARGSDWFSLQVGSHGIGVAFGSTDWWAYGPSWADPHVRLSYDQVLDGYGEWLWVGGLGRVWCPWVVAGWTPYHYGRWVVTPAGWTWLSYEPWGYFPHHYGHWAYTSYGWVWVPGYDYRPANVVWVRWGGYVGWYPSPPNGWSHAARGFQHGYRSGYRDGYPDGYRNGYDDGWRDAYWATYVPWDQLGSHDVSRYSMSSTTVRRTAANSPLRLSSDAPSRSEVQQRGGEMAPTARLEQRTVAVGGRSVTVARPEGMAPTVQLHGRSTVERALAPDVSRRVVGRGTRPDAAAAIESTPPRPSVQVDQGGRLSPFDRSLPGSIRSGQEPVVSKPSSSSRPRAVVDRTDGRSSDRAIAEPQHRGSLPVIQGSDVVAHPPPRDLERTEPQQRIDAPRVDTSRIAEPRVSVTRSPAPLAAPRTRRSGSDDGGDQERDAEPLGRKHVSERRTHGTDGAKHR
jgi:hypothetical protein